MQSVVLTEFGIVVLDETGGEVVKTFEFSDPLGQYMAVKKRDGIPNELVRYLDGLQTGVAVNDKSLLFLLNKTEVEAHLMAESEVDKITLEKPRLLVDAKFAKDPRDALNRLRDFAVSMSASKVSEVSASPDLHIVQAVNTLDEIDKISNTFSSMLREWYGLHFPELDNLVDSIAGYSHIVLVGKRSNLSKAVFEEAGFPESKADMLELVRQKSIGGDISDENLAIVKSLARQILELRSLRDALGGHLDEQMESVAPNLSAILGSVVGARMLAKAGGLKKLASLPASTIQILGAERALFRSLKSGSQPPKHGILFQHSLVHAAPRWQRGKIARAIAAKAAIATRVDVYGSGLNETLLERLNIRVDEIGKKYNKPPKKEGLEGGAGTGSKREQGGRGRGVRRFGGGSRARSRGKPKNGFRRR